MITSTRLGSLARVLVGISCLGGVSSGGGACKSSTPAMAVDMGASSGNEVSADREVGPDRELCQRSCDVVATVVCPDQRPGCVERCEQSLTVQTCIAEIRAVISCGIAQGPSGFHCDALNMTVLNAGLCASEQAAVVACLRTDAAG